MDLWAVFILSVLLMPLVLATSGPLRAIAGSAFLLLALGYALVAALFPRKEGLDGVERLALGIGLSALMVPATAYALNATPWGIKPGLLLATLVSLALALTGMAWIRRRRVSPDQRFEPKAGLQFALAGWRRLVFVQKALATLLAVAVAGTLVMVIYLGTSPPVREVFTEFYVLDSQGAIGGYPRNMQVGDEGKVRLVIANWENRTVDYRVEVRAGTQQLEVISPVTLEHAQVWDQEVSFVPPIPGRDQKIEFLLFRDNRPESYQSLYINVNVVSPS